MSYSLPPESARSCRHAAGCVSEVCSVFRGMLAQKRSFLRALPIASIVVLAAGLQAQFATAVGSPATQTITVTAQATGTVSTVEVLTAGAPGRDFTAAGGGSCNGAGLVVTGQCTQPVTFTPAYPGLRTGAVVLLSSSNQVIGTAFLNGTGTGGLGVLVPSAVQSAAIAGAAPGTPVPAAGTALTLAGDGQWQDSNIGDGNAASQAELFLPSAVAVDGYGNFYIADSNHERVRMVCAGSKTTIAGTNCPSGGIINTVAGAVGTQLRTPSGVAVDGAGNLYIADTGNHVVRVLSAATGAMTTVAGTGAAGYSGDNGPATSAELGSPFAVALDGQGDLFIADNAQNVIRVVCAVPGSILGVACTAAGDIVTVAGTGTAGATGDGGPAIAAQLNGPYSIAIDASGDIFVADTENNKVRGVCAAASGSLFGASCNAVGMIFTVTGDGNGAYSGDGGPAAQAEVNSPSGLALDPAGDLYIADTQNNRIRKINAGTGIIITLAGTGAPNFGGDQGPALAASIHGPYGLAFYNAAPCSCTQLHLGDLLVADYLDQRIRSVESNLAIVSIADPVRQGYTSPAPTVNTDPTLVTVENDGNAALDLSSLTAGTNTELGSQAIAGINLCGNGNSLVEGAQCTVEPIFAPAAAPPLTTPSAQESGNIDVNNDVVPGTTAANSPLVITLNGTATLVNPTQVVLTSQPNPSTFGQSVLFTATVSITSGSGKPTGTVDFFDGATKLDTNAVSIDGSGSATFSISTLAVGAHQIVATYNGDTDDDSSTSAAVTQVVDEPTATALQSSQNPSNPGVSVTFTATVTTPNGGGVTPDGTVTFFDGATPLATQPLTGNTATYTTSTLSEGVHAITAVYSGDAGNNINGSTSGVLNQDVLGQSTIVLSPPTPNPSIYGAAVALTATVTANGSIAPTGTVTFLDGGNKIGTGTLNGSVAMLSITTLTVGVHTLTATYPGNADIAAGTSNAQTLTVNATSTTTTVSATPTPGIAGKPTALAATVTDVQGTAAVTGQVTFTSGSTTLCQSPVGANGGAGCNVTLAPGSYSIVASYGGNTDAGASASQPLPYIVNATATTTAVAAAPTPGIAGKPVGLTATVTDLQGAPITGTVTFTSGTATLCQGAVGAGGTANCNVSLAPGSYSIVASYGGNANDNASASQLLSYKVVQATTQVALSSSANPAQVLSAVVFKAVVSGNGGTPTGQVTFSVDGTAANTAAIDSTGTVTFSDSSLAVGSHQVTATYNGDADDAGSSSSALAEVITAIPTVTDLGLSSTGGTTPQAILVSTTLGATGPKPTGTVTFFNGNTNVGSGTLDSSGVATFTPDLPPGNYSVVAKYSGDSLHSASTSQSISFTGAAAGFSISVAPPTLSLVTGQNGTINITIEATTGFSDTIGMGCLSLPASVNCHFSSNSVKVAAGQSQVVQLTIDTNAPLSGGQSASVRGSSGRNLSLAGLFLPGSLLLGFVFWRFRRRHVGLFLGAIVLMLAGAFSLSGCGASFSQITAAPGSYTIQVGGVGTGSNVSHYENVTLTVTK